jgi:60 kDa SS-A/Ro ribonucleoprotein
MDYAKHVSAKRTPQQEPILGEDQTLNEAGGYVFTVSPHERLKRFLILGSEGPTYYQTERKLTQKNAENIYECIHQDSIKDRATCARTAEIIVDFWNSNRAPKPNPILFALAIVASAGSPAHKEYIATKFNETVRTGYQLFRFVHYATEFRGWGRFLKRLVRKWYLTPEQLAYQGAKYQQREGWSHRDLLRLAHPKIPTEMRPNHVGLGQVLQTLAGKGTPEDEPILFKIMKSLVDPDVSPERKANIIRAEKLTHEMIPSSLKKHKAVWEALLEGMPLGALLRNLGTLGAREIIGLGQFEKNAEVSSRLVSPTALAKARIHPIGVLAAAAVYTRGRGIRGSQKWTPSPEIMAALEAAFHLSFDSVEPTQKRYLLGLDVSSSMSWGDVAGIPGLTPATAAGAMLMTTLRREPYCVPMAFAEKFRQLPVSKISTLREVMDLITNVNFGRTDCARPMIYALEREIEVDVFVIYTDNETWFGNVHPCQALQEYRRKINPKAKLVVVAFTATKSSIANPKDPGMLDVVGFDAAAPTVMAEFAKL